MGAPTCLTCRSRYAYRNAGANPICLSKRGCELNLLIEPRALTQFPDRKANENSMCLSKRGCELNLLIEARLRPFWCDRNVSRVARVSSKRPKQALAVQPGRPTSSLSRKWAKRKRRKRARPHRAPQRTPERPKKQRITTVRWPFLGAPDRAQENPNGASKTPLGHRGGHQNSAKEKPRDP